MNSLASFLIIPCIILAITATAFAGITEVCPLLPRIKVLLTAKDGTTFEFRERYEITKYAIFYEYDIGNASAGYQDIYQGKTYTDSETCPRGRAANLYGNPTSALIKHEYFKRDFNADGISDLNLSLAIKLCKNGDIKFIEYLILSTADGFKVVRHNDEDEKIIGN